MSENEIVSADAVELACAAEHERRGDDWSNGLPPYKSVYRTAMRAALLASGYPQKVAELERELKAHEDGLGKALGENIVADNDRLRAENAALKADAERYRWLRSIVPDSLVDTAHRWRYVSPTEPDAAIDAAIAASHPEQP